MWKDKIGLDVHLAGTVWIDQVTGRSYVLPLNWDFELELIEPEILYFDCHESMDILNQAWLLEAKRYDGYRGHLTKVALKRQQRQVQPKIIWKVFRRDNFTCVYCGDNEGPMTFDHFIPESQGGPTTVENGRTACRQCNKLKADMSAEQFLASKEFIKRKAWIAKLKAKYEHKPEQNEDEPTAVL